MKYIEWDLENNPEFFSKPRDGKYVDTGVLLHVLCNVMRPAGVGQATFMKVMTAVVKEVELIPQADWVIELQRIDEACQEAADTCHRCMTQALHNEHVTSGDMAAVAYFDERERLFRYEIPGLIRTITKENEEAKRRTSSDHFHRV